MLMSLALLSVVLAFPFFLVGLLWSIFKVLNTDEAQNKYGSAYSSLKTDKKSTLLYSLLYLLRRLLLASLAFFCTDYPFLQVQLMIFHSVLFSLYLIHVSPFLTPFMNRLETFNELCILAASYHLLAFTGDFLSDPETQYQVGWSLLGVTVFNVAVNMLLVLWECLINIKRAVQMLKNKIDQWR
jgi:hypothetical protein